MEINDRIKILRKEYLKISQEEFGERIGVTRSNIGNIETGTINTTDRVCRSVSKEFNVEPLWLTTGEGDIFCLGKKNEVARKIVEVMDDLPDEYWEMLGDIIDRYNKKK
ncbi:MAG: helix-turn-helix transcriptional regulator [Clostridiales bacterium]